MRLFYITAAHLALPTCGYCSMLQASMVRLKADGKAYLT